MASGGSWNRADPGRAVKVKLRLNKYSDAERAAEVIGLGDHRKWVGGLWHEIGDLQFDFLLGRSLRPDMRVLDIGCGCFRCGVPLLRYLDPGCYYGTDISQELMDAGYSQELVPLGLDSKLPRENLFCNEDFQVDHFGVKFDVVLAQSLFTHLPLNHFRLCMARLVNSVNVGGIACITAFICPDGHDLNTPYRHPRGGITTHPASDPYHYRVADFEYCLRGMPWQLDYQLDWGHPRNQSMLTITRTQD